MILIEDTRQKAGKHQLKREYFNKNGIIVTRAKLDYGDYMILTDEADPTNKMPRTTVDTKKDIFELAQDIDQEHKRFKAECVGARDNNYELIVLVENNDDVHNIGDLMKWTEPEEHFLMRKRRSKNPRTRRIEGTRLARACMTMSERYGVVFLFCTPEEAGKVVVDLLTHKIETRKGNVIYAEYQNA